jgi:hypothetical protein
VHSERRCSLIDFSTGTARRKHLTLVCATATDLKAKAAAAGAASPLTEGLLERGRQELLKSANRLADLLEALNSGDEKKIEFARAESEVWLAIQYPAKSQLSFPTSPPSIQKEYPMMATKTPAIYGVSGSCIIFWIKSGSFLILWATAFAAATAANAFSSDIQPSSAGSLLSQDLTRAAHSRCDSLPSVAGL